MSMRANQFNFRGVMYVLVCVCVCVREREREKERTRMYTTATHLDIHINACYVRGQAAPPA